MSAIAPFLPAERDEVLAYLRSVYGNVFTDAAIKAHLENHVGFAASDYAIAVVTPHACPGARLLDVGSGFGSCVLAARQKGFDAVGVEMAPFEVKFARERLARVRPQDEPEAVYRLGSFLDFDAPDGSFDILTFWNVLEHIEDLQTTLSTAKRLLRKGGILYAVCPNYFAWRLEAHYHVPWKPNPLLPREKAIAYLKSLGRDPSFFEKCIFRRTNWEVLGHLRGLGFEPRDIGTLESRKISIRNLTTIMRRPRQFASFYNPFRHSVLLAASKF